MSLRLKLEIIYLKKYWLDIKHDYLKKFISKMKDWVLGEENEVWETAKFYRTFTTPSGQVINFEWVTIWEERTRLYLYRKKLTDMRLRCTTDTSGIIGWLCTDKSDPEEAYYDLIAKSADFKSHWLKLSMMAETLPSKTGFI